MPSMAGQMEFVAVNNRIVPAAEAMLPALGQGARYGSGCFETIALAGGQPRLWALHWLRFSWSCQRLGLRLRLDEPTLRTLVAELAGLNGIDGDGVARLSAHAADGVADTVLTVGPLRRKVLPPAFRLGVSPLRHPGAGPFCGIKHNNYGWFMAAFEQGAQVCALDDAVMLGASGEVLEGSRSNLFFVSLKNAVDAASGASVGAAVDATTGASVGVAADTSAGAADFAAELFSPALAPAFAAAGDGVPGCSAIAAEGICDQLKEAFEGFTLVTAPLSSGVLPGVVREVVLRTALAHGLPVLPRALPLERIAAGALACFATSALIGIMPIAQIGDLRFDMQNPAASAVRALRARVAQ